MATLPAQAAGYAGRPVADVLDEFRALGLPIVYSTNLVDAALRVLSEPAAAVLPLSVATEILAPHGLALRNEHGLYLVVRNEAGAGHVADEGAALLVLVRREDTLDPIATPRVVAEPPLPAPRVLGQGLLQFQPVPDGEYRLTVSAPGHRASDRVVNVRGARTRAVAVNLAQGPLQLSPVVVSTSRYTLERDALRAPRVLGQHSIDALPDLGADPLRALQRLPGATAGSWSARTHVRGGHVDEVAVYLNGLRLFDPYHIRDYQSIFSAVDVRAIDTVEIYTGGFPVRYGDSLSALVLIDAVEPHPAARAEIGLSAFNTSLLASGGRDDGRATWLVSARRGNLDLIIDPRFGEPSYYDLFGELAFDLSSRTRIAANALVANDGVTVITESDGTELERVDSTTRNAQFWVVGETHWHEALHSTTLLAFTRFSNARDGRLFEEEKIDGRVDDVRRVRQWRLEQVWNYGGWQDHRLRLGFEAARLDAHYDYASEVAYDGAFAALDGATAPPPRAMALSPSGSALGAFVSDRWQIDGRYALEAGLRLDRQTYNGDAGRRQISPRLSLHRRLGPRTDLRVGWGRFFQSQGIHQLQVEDGVTQFFDAERADHFIVGLEHTFAGGMALRAEAFDKRIRNVRPRFENQLDSLAPVPELAPDRILAAPTGSRMRGLEVTLRRDAQPAWWASYTLSRAWDRIGGASVPRRVDQRHALHAGWSWDGPQWQFGVAVTAHTGWPRTALALAGSDDAPRIVRGARNARRYGAYASLDARLARRFTLSRGALEVFAEVSNLTNRHNPCCTDFDLGEEPGGAPVLEQAIEYGLGLLPAVGVLWEFE